MARAAPSTVLPADERKRLLERATHVLCSWRLSPFELEGTTRQALRSRLCLEGLPWAASDREAHAIVQDALRHMGAERPSWEEGQREFTLGRHTCARCAGPLPPEAYAGKRTWRFCSQACAQAYVATRTYPEDIQTNVIGLAAYKLLARARTVPRECRQCGTGFHPLHEKDAQIYCSSACWGAARRKHHEKTCPVCSAAFFPERAGQVFCSKACVNQREVKPSHPKECRCCAAPFLAKRPDTLFCSRRCAKLDQVYRTRTNVPRTFTPPAFDYFVVPMAA